MSIYRARLRNNSNALSPRVSSANGYVFKSRLNCSESTAGSLRQSGSEFQTVGPATEKARVLKYAIFVHSLLAVDTTGPQRNI